jgi:hypothetical protein
MVTLLLVVQPGFERATTGKDITVIRGIRGELVKEEDDGDRDKGSEYYERGTRGHDS